MKSYFLREIDCLKNQVNLTEILHSVKNRNFSLNIYKLTDKTHPIFTRHNEKNSSRDSHAKISGMKVPIKQKKSNKNRC